MPGLVSQIESAVGGLDLARLAEGTGGQYSAIAQAIGGWHAGPPGDFGTAVTGLGALSAPDFSFAGSLSDGLSGLLPALQGGGLDGIVSTLQGDVSALPARLQHDLMGALKPLLDRVQTLQTLLTSDWSCGLIPALATAAPMPAPAPAPAPVPSPAPGPAPAPAPAPAAQGALSTAQVDAARSLVDSVPADMTVPSLMHWLHDRVGTFRPGYFALRSLPLLDDVRDPLDTLIRWEAASATAVTTELGQTLAALTALVQQQSVGVLAAALSAPVVAALAGASPAVPAEAYAVALEALANDAKAAGLSGNVAALPARLAAAQAARAPLLAANVVLAGLAAPQEALRSGLLDLPAALDAGLCRLLVLLQPRPSLADLGVGSPAPPPLPADAFAPVQQLLADLQQHLTDVLDLLDVSSVTAPVAAALSGVTAAVQSVEQGLAQLSAQALQAIAQARSVVQSIDLDALRTEAQAALQGVTDQLTAAVAQALGGATAALGDALTVVHDALAALDPEQLTGPVREAIQALGTLIQQEAVQRLAEVVDQLEALAEQVAELSFEPVADGVIAAIGELKGVLEGIDPATLPSPGPELIAEAMKLLPTTLVPLTDPLVADLGKQLDGSPTAALEQVKGLPDLVRGKLLAFSPRAALAPVLAAPFRQAVGQLDAFDPLQWLSAADAALAQLRQRMAAQLDIAAALAPAAKMHAAGLAALDGLRPSTLLQPLEQAMEAALRAVAEAVPLGDVAAGLNGALDRVRAATRTVDQAMDVADHVVVRLNALGNADGEFAAWIDGILAKVPAAASGGLATALADLRAAALATRPADLAAAWAAARQPLADALGASQATALLTRITLARGALQSAMAAQPTVAAVPGLAAWVAEPATRSATDGLAALAALARVLADTDTALQAAFASWTSRFPHAEGPLAPLLPETGGALRDTVREAVMRQFGTPMIGLLSSLKALGQLLAVTVAGLRGLVMAVEARLTALLAAPQALADLLGSVDQVQQRLAALDLGLYTREIDTVYVALLDDVRALDPRQLVQPLEASRDRLLGLISLTGVLPPALRGQLTEAKRQLTAQLGAVDPEALLLEPLDAEYRELVEPLVAALDISASVQVLIDWLHQLPDDLRVQIDRVDGAYGELLRSAPGGSGGGASQGLSL